MAKQLDSSAPADPLLSFSDHDLFDYIETITGELATLVEASCEPQIGYLLRIAQREAGSVLKRLSLSRTGTP